MEEMGFPAVPRWGVWRTPIGAADASDSAPYCVVAQSQNRPAGVDRGVPYLRTVPKKTGEARISGREAARPRLLGGGDDRHGRSEHPSRQSGQQVHSELHLLPVPWSPFGAMQGFDVVGGSTGVRAVRVPFGHASCFGKK